MVKINSKLLPIKNANSTETDEIYSCNYTNQQINNAVMTSLANGTNINNVVDTGRYKVFNATGTLPIGYSTSDNNFFLEVFKWTDTYCRQIFYDIRTANSFTRMLNNGTWSKWFPIQTTIAQTNDQNCLMVNATTTQGANLGYNPSNAPEANKMVMWWTYKTDNTSAASYWTYIVIAFTLDDKKLWLNAYHNSTSSWMGWNQI